VKATGVAAQQRRGSASRRESGRRRRVDMFAGEFIRLADVDQGEFARSEFAGE
jgi:hypothetical protein